MAWKKKQKLIQLQKSYNFIVENLDNCNVEELNEIEAKLKDYKTGEWKKAQVRVRNTFKEEGENHLNSF